MRFIARFIGEGGVKHIRYITAKHLCHASYKAGGVAKANRWKLQSVGLV